MFRVKNIISFGEPCIDGNGIHFIPKRSVPGFEAQQYKKWR
jgi:hypothetical protein